MTFPAAVVFDMDGILIETEPIWDEVRRGLAAAEGLAWPDEATQAMMGMSTPEWSTYLAETVRLSGTPPEIATRVIDGVAAAYADHLPVLRGAVDAVRRMAERGPVGIASSSPRRLIDLVTEQLGLTGWLTVTVSTEEVERGKPWPDGYELACALLGVDPAQSVAVEDSTNGIRSARAAGMTVICVPPAFHPPAPEVQALAAAVLDNLDELDAELLARLPAEGQGAES